MHESRILAVEHISLESPPGLEGEHRWFYGELAELEEVVREKQAGHPLLVFFSRPIELRIRITPEPDIRSTKTSVVILVSSLSTAMGQCRERRIDYIRLSGIDSTDRRIQLLDPGGNRVELKQYWPYAPL